MYLRVLYGPNLSNDERDENTLRSKIGKACRLYQQRIDTTQKPSSATHQKKSIF